MREVEWSFGRTGNRRSNRSLTNLSNRPLFSTTEAGILTRSRRFTITPAIGTCFSWICLGMSPKAPYPDLTRHTYCDKTRFFPPDTLLVTHWQFSEPMPQNTEPDCYLANVGMPIYCSIVKRKTTLLFMFERASLYEACDVFVFHAGYAFVSV